MHVRVASLIVVAAFAAACSSSPTTAPTPTPTGGAGQPSGPGPTATPAGQPSAEPTAQPGQPTPAPSEAASSGEPTVGPSGSLTPSVDSFTVKRTASCTSDNGTGTVGMIRLTWTTSGTTGVRVSIDPPSPAQAYGYGFADYATPSGFADVPFACGAPNHDATGAYHLYVVTTLHTSGFAYYRYAKVYEIVPAATP